MIEQGNCTYLTRVVTWVRNSEIDSSVAKLGEEEEEEEEESSFNEFLSFPSADGPSILAGAEAFDEAPLPTFKGRRRVHK